MDCARNRNLTYSPKSGPLGNSGWGGATAAFAVCERSKMTEHKHHGKPKLTGARILWECLEREGVKTIFGYPGGAILPAYDALKHSSIHHILVRHEQGATHMADGFARATGGVGVAIATSGPGATNMVTGIATAMMDSSPIVCITGQVGSKVLGSDAFQETDITGVTLPITKHNYLVTHASEVAHAVREAFYVAKSGRPGPVLIDITKDAQQGTAEFDWEAAEPHMRGYRPDLSPANEEYERALKLIHGAKRPVILGGSRNPGFRRYRRSASLCGANVDSRGAHIIGAGRAAGVSFSQSWHDGHARRGLGEHDHPGSRSSAGVWHALRRSRHRQPEDLRAEREEDPRRYRPSRDQQERESGRGTGRRLAQDSAGAVASRGAGRSPGMATVHSSAQG